MHKFVDIEILLIDISKINVSVKFRDIPLISVSDLTLNFTSIITLCSAIFQRQSSVCILYLALIGGKFLLFR